VRAAQIGASEHLLKLYLGTNGVELRGVAGSSYGSGNASRSRLSASVSKLARSFAAGAGEGSNPGDSAPNWKLYRPKPLEVDDVAESTDMPSVRRFGGAINNEGSDCSCCAANSRWASGDDGLLVWCMEIGDGGTNGKASSIESAVEVRCEVAIVDWDILLLVSSSKERGTLCAGGDN
jgi:hypothetical protein